MKWSSENRQFKILKIFSFLISPFLSLLLSLRRLNTKSSIAIWFMFGAFFGLSFTIDEDRGYDSSHYKYLFERYQHIKFDEFKVIIIDFFKFDGVKKDIYFDVIAFTISRFTDNYHILFLVVSIVFSFFALKSLRFLISDNKFEFSFICLILLYLFFSNHLFNINGVRMWTAGWVGVYCIFQIFRNDNKFYLLLLLITPLIHGSFWILIVLVLLTLITLFFKISYKLLVIIFFLSFIVGTISIEIIQRFSTSLPVFMEKMIASYTDAEYIEFRNEVQSSTASFIKNVSDNIIKLYANLLVYFFIKNTTLISSNFKSRKLFVFLLVFMSFVNATIAIPSLGGRFLILCFPIISYLWLVNFYKVKYSIIIKMIPIFFIYQIFYQLVLYRNVLEIDFIIGNPIYLIYRYIIIP